MTTTNSPAGHGTGLAELIRGPVAVGLPLGSVIGAVVGGATRGNLTGGAVVGSVFALLVIVSVILAEVYTGALGVPHRRPFRPGDRFAGWTVVGRLRSTPGQTTEYEVRRRDLRGKLTVSLLDRSGPPSDTSSDSHPLRQIQSRHLIHPVDLGRVGEFEFLVTELDGSESLADRVRKAGVLSGEPLFAMAAGTAVALHDIHAGGAVHGQVRPDRVAVGGARTALYSFAPLSRSRDANTYLAPEQTLGADVSTAKSDVFSWASTVFYAAVGRPPFSFGQGGGLEARPNEPSLQRCPEWIQPVLAAAFTEDPKERPTSATVLEQLRVLGQEYRWRIVGAEPQTTVWSKPPVRVPARAVAVTLLAILLTALLPAAVPSAGSSTAAPPAAATSPVDPGTGPPAAPPSTTTTSVATTSTTTSTSDVTSTTTPTTTTTPAPAVAKWPTTANDGEPAFYTYLGASFILPDWVACASGHCIVGSENQVYLFTDHPINQIGQTNMAVQNPQRALTDLGLTQAQADSLLTR